jgi:hypothetical protein
MGNFYCLIDEKILLQMIFLSGLTQTKLRFRLLEVQITLMRNLGLITFRQAEPDTSFILVMTCNDYFFGGVIAPIPTQTILFFGVYLR